MAAPDRRQPGDRLRAPQAAPRRDRAARLRRRAGGARRRRGTGRRHRAFAARAAGRDRASPPARLHAGRDRRAARAPAWNRELSLAPRARRAEGGAVRRELERLEVPGEHEARERAWALVQAAYSEREPGPPRRLTPRPILVAAAVAALVAAALSPAGRAVLDGVREAVGVESASESLFEVPSGGRLLVTAD